MRGLSVDKIGKVYGVGVGPGDPELMTLKAVRLIRESTVIAAAGKEIEKSKAYQIARAAVPEIEEKTKLSLPMPMTSDPEMLRKAHEEAVRSMQTFLDQGISVVYITLGDPTIYCTFSYLQKILKKEGYDVELVSGVPSFCAAAARLGISLAEKEEELHIIPAVYGLDEKLEYPGRHVLMKSAGCIQEVKALLQNSGRQVMAVENCGMAEEAVYRSADEIPEDAGYFTIVIA